MLRITQLPPGPRLREHVRRLAAWSERAAPTTRTEVPLAGTVIVLSLGPDMLVDGDWTGSFAGGVYDRPIVTGHAGEQAGIQLDLDPFAARALLGIPADELRNRSVPLADVLPDARELTERVADAPDTLARRRLLDELLGARIGAGPAPSPEVVRAYVRLAATHGAARVERLAQEVGWSRRHLAARFRLEVGASPKTVARILRFARAVELLRAGSAIADAAFGAGYADQPHFNREFHAFMGMPPGEFPFVQDATAAA